MVLTQGMVSFDSLEFVKKPWNLVEYRIGWIPSQKTQESSVDYPVNLNEHLLNFSASAD